MLRSQAVLITSYYIQAASSPLPWSGAWKFPIVMINRKTEIDWIMLPLSMKPSGVDIMTFTFIALAVAHPYIYPLLNTVSKLIMVIIFIILYSRFILVALSLAMFILVLDSFALATTASMRGFTCLLCPLDLPFITRKRKF